MQQHITKFDPQIICQILCPFIRILTVLHLLQHIMLFPTQCNIIQTATEKHHINVDALHVHFREHNYGQCEHRLTFGRQAWYGA